MDERSPISRAMPDNGMAAPAGYPASDGEPDWLAGDRATLDLIARFARMTAWLFALLGALLFFAVAASLASAEFGIGPSSYLGGGAGGEELFTRGSADTGDAPNIGP